MSFEPPDLPYAENALEPWISSRTVGFHYNKHHLGYASRLADLTKGTEMEGLGLEEVILAAGPGAVFNNAAQIWNHSFYWESMSPDGGGDPGGDLAAAIDASFGSADEFRQEFSEKAMGLFGSGWVWLVVPAKEKTKSEEKGGLEILTTLNADLPLKSGSSSGQQALLTLDVWEHAYYLDYQNLRKDYIQKWLENLLNWEFAAAGFEAAQAGK